MAFVEASYSPLLESNYMAFSVIPTLTADSISSNLGVYVTLIYFGSFVLFLLTGCCNEEKKTQQRNLELLTQELDIEKRSKYSP